MLVRVWDRIAKNPLAALLGFFLLISVYGSYQTGSKLTEVCDRLGDEIADKRIETICAEREPDDYGETELGLF